MAGVAQALPVIGVVGATGPQRRLVIYLSRRDDAIAIVALHAQRVLLQVLTADALKGATANPRRRFVRQLVQAIRR